jgi:Flp pilus assembly protein TadD
LRAVSLLALLALAIPGATTLADQRDARLAPLFERLHGADDAGEAHRVEQAIWGIWLATDDLEAQRLLELGTVAMANRSWGAAGAAFDRLVERAPGFAEGWNKRATYYWLVRDFGASVRDIQQTLALEPRHFGALSGLGLILMETGDTAGAIRAFDAALELHPFLPGARENLQQLKERAEGEPL